ncbi:hypothetical protein LWC08_09075 [Desulfobaculum bizertense]|uniref:hypothetical protein n=1 Tax=Desulfobaculum bizertense TaxID=376490 RepID=UPI001F2371B5|nr:hypothetical protein [Desulfobaculum bizertense]UIJ36891.1 hypothetical protein LWC08_09075 [Desulfobaculum bizertense]
MLDNVMNAIARNIIQSPEIASLCHDAWGHPLSVYSGYLPDESPELHDVPCVQIASADRSRSTNLNNREHLLLLGVFSLSGGYIKSHEGYFYQPERKHHEELAAYCEQIAAETMLRENVSCTPVSASADQQWSYQGFGSFYGFHLSFYSPLA